MSSFNQRVPGEETSKDIGAGQLGGGHEGTPAHAESPASHAGGGGGAMVPSCENASGASPTPHAGACAAGEAGHAGGCNGGTGAVGRAGATGTVLKMAGELPARRVGELGVHAGGETA